jgi:hypothetical protein
MISRDGTKGYDELQALLEVIMPLSYKKWSDTCIWAQQLKSIIGDPTDEDFKFTFDRVLSGGNWFQAEEYARKSTTSGQPWVVLVAGLNGIRKSTSLYQPWFRSCLKEALGESVDESELPTGGNGFFRQLDYLVATIGNQEFAELYQASTEITTDEYSSLKDGIFKRYRTAAEVLGVLLLQSAAKQGMNIFVETSGRDVASFDFIDELFADRPDYRKLVLHFTIDDISHAERSVDSRMDSEMQAGKEIMGADKLDLRSLVAVNNGGPYGSSVLKGVKADSDRVMNDVFQNNARRDWHKASIKILGSEDSSQWTAKAVLPDGSVSSSSHVFRR